MYVYAKQTSYKQNNSHNFFFWLLCYKLKIMICILLHTIKKRVEIFQKYVRTYICIWWIYVHTSESLKIWWLLIFLLQIHKQQWKSCCCATNT